MVIVFNIFIVCVLFFVVFCVLYFISVNNKYQVKKLKSAAKTRGFNYLGKVNKKDSLSLIFKSTSPNDIRNNNMMQDVLEGDVNGYQVQYYRYYGLDANQKGMFQVVTWEIDLGNNNVQFVLIDNNFVKKIKSKKFDKFTKFNLEGNFNSLYTLYSIDNMRVELLQVFDPVFMDYLMNKFNPCALEITKSKLHIYLKPDITNDYESDFIRDYANLQEIINESKIFNTDVVFEHGKSGFN